MKIIAASIGTGLGVLLAALPAYAGPCSTEIETLTQVLAGTGTGSSLSSTAAMPKAPATAGTLPANPLEPAQVPKVTGASTIPKAPSTTGSLPANPLASTTEGANALGAPGAADGDAAASLQHARELDAAGDEASCMAEVAKAKQMIGIQ